MCGCMIALRCRGPDLIRRTGELSRCPGCNRICRTSPGAGVRAYLAVGGGLPNGRSAAATPADGSPPSSRLSTALTRDPVLLGIFLFTVSFAMVNLADVGTFAMRTQLFWWEQVLLDVGPGGRDLAVGTAART